MGRMSDLDVMTQALGKNRRPDLLPEYPPAGAIDGEVFEYSSPADIDYSLDLTHWAGAHLVAPGGMKAWYPGGRRYRLDTRGCKGPVTVKARVGGPIFGSI